MFQRRRGTLMNTEGAGEQGNDGERVKVLAGGRLQRMLQAI